MQRELSDAERLALREWLRAERKLGILHVDGALGRAAGPARSAAPTATQPPVSSGAPAPASARPPRADDRPPPTAADFSRSAAAPPRPTAMPELTVIPARPPGVLPPFNTRDLSADEARRQLDELDQQFVRSCRACGLCAGRTQTVFGVGNPRPELLFIGEGPGADEDRVGEPFVGKAGQLLTRMIGGMTLTRDQVYIANVVKCRPPENRPPTDEESAACLPYLLRQIAILRPRFIVTLGKSATVTVLNMNLPMGRMRGEWHDFPPPALTDQPLPAARVMPTFHPAYLLRNPPAKREVWEDLKQVMAAMGIPIPARGE